jgi:DNA-binding MarR family transcriptional regulator
MKTKTAVDLIHTVNDECSACLPINNSLIPLLILNQAMNHHLSNKDLPLKNLYAAIRSSELGARNHLSRLEKNSWLAIEKSSTDTRVKLIKPTKKLLDTYEHISNTLSASAERLCFDCPRLKDKS